jgi:hypothetical protein
MHQQRPSKHQLRPPPKKNNLFILKILSMKHNTSTTLDLLIEGDIFYKQGDAKKTKLLLHKKDMEHKRAICVDPECAPDLRDKEFMQKWLSLDKPVIFLRRTQHTDIGDPTLLLPGEKAAGIVAGVVSMIIIIFLTCAPATRAKAQAMFNIGANFSSKTMGPGGTIEAGGRIGSFVYSGIHLSAYSHGYPSLAGGVVLGTAHSWNNGKMHELTTVFYGKYEKAIIMDDDFKANPPSPFGFGIRHYVYNAYVDVAYQPNQIILTIGYSFGQIFK